MKVTTSVIMTCWLVLVGALCSADGPPSGSTREKRESITTNQYAVDESKVRRNQKLRAWVDSIKPAAGHVEPAAQPKNEYWQQSVRRENRGTMKE